MLILIKNADNWKIKTYLRKWLVEDLQDRFAGFVLIHGTLLKAMCNVLNRRLQCDLQYSS
jgi:hypothetical protein